MKRKYILILVLTLTLLFSGCGRKKSQFKTLQQIQQEQGIPVRVKTVELETFVQELIYNAALSGREESSGQALVSEVVNSVKAKIGDRVTAGQIIVTFPRNTPSAQYEQALTAYNAAKTTYERMRNLYANGAISRQELDNIETQFKVTEANLNASDKMINVRAPISGIITSISVSPGERSYPGQNLFTISTTNGYKAKIMVADKDALKLKIGTPATATWENITLTGNISKISLALDPYQKAIPVEVTFPSKGHSIRFGSTAQIKLQVLAKPNCIVVNREHIVNENDKQFVWINQNNYAIKREITTGLDNQLQFEVISGIEPGEQLIVEGMSLLTDKALIRVIE
ncbi:MAG: efflux RND transporter periplasmic adaptor subunit [Candidatus Cloacimonadaceae bacterium]|jgi:RND family efflux transporter MFP subunit|nr:efflux RND transporter periplasmic adaptor subunit [Candidatus Cloacimonadota bacterium]MDD5625095.1 efflux RND transporter periplasmic adaptor subunit [Candidatus Cloacimonadota bacterium]MDY0112149.1 efflux RND transporter periplasmic adaptor subunit [Candidatus Syntrophosphaera sp.]